MLGLALGQHVVIGTGARGAAVAGDHQFARGVELALDQEGRDERYAHALGRRLSEHRQQLQAHVAHAVRNFMDTLRTTGVEANGPAAFSAADRQGFANRLDRLLRSWGQE